MKTGFVRHFVPVLVILSWLSVPAQARVVYVQHSHPCIFEVREQGSNLWVRAEPSTVHDSVAELELPSRDLELRARAYPPPYLYFYLGEAALNFDQSHVYLLMEPELWWPWPVLLCVLLAASGLRSRLQRLADAQRIGAEAEAEAEADDFLPAHGQLPQGLVGGRRCLRRVGEGSLGVVYQAETASGALCALKVPRPGGLPEAGQRQAQQIGRLQHPGLVCCQALSLGERPLLQLEWLQGVTAEATPPREPAAEWQRCRVWAQQVLEVLSYLHAQGTVHRNLHPGNLMVLPDGRIKVMDPGIAHDEAADASAPGATDSRLSCRSPQLQAGLPAVAADDLYALGTILLQRLGGRVEPAPVILPEPQAASACAAQEPAASDAEPPPLLQLDSTIPLPVSLWVAQLTRRQREQRPATPQEALAALPD